MDWLDELVAEIASIEQNLVSSLTKLSRNENFLSDDTSRHEAVTSFLKLMSQINIDNDMCRVYTSLCDIYLSSEEQKVSIDNLLTNLKQEDDNEKFYIKFFEILMKFEYYEEAVILTCDVNNYCETLEYLTELNSGNLDQRKQIMSVRSQLFSQFLNHLDSETSSKNITQVIAQHKAKNAATGIVVVDPLGARRVEDRVLYVTKLQDGLQMCKNGGLLFLKNHNYEAENFDIVHVNRDKKLEIIGESCADCSISGSIRIASSSSVSFTNIKFEVGDSAESNDSINIFSGNISYDNCVFECFVNTAFFLHPCKQDSLDLKTKITFKHCIFEGLSSCQRIFSVENGLFLQLIVDTCYFNECYSVLTVPQVTTQWKYVNIHASNCSFNDVQDGVKVMSADKECFELEVNDCDFNMVLYDEEQPSNSISVVKARKLRVKNCLFVYNHTQGTAIAAEDVDALQLCDNSVITDHEVDRKLSTSIATCLTSICHAEVLSCYFSGTRIGLLLSACQKVEIGESSFDACSVGLYVGHNSNIDQVSVKTSTFQSCFDGFLIEGLINSCTIQNCSFIDVVEPVLNNTSNSVVITSCTKQFSEEIKMMKDGNLLPITTENNDSTDIEAAPILHMLEEQSIDDDIKVTKDSKEIKSEDSVENSDSDDITNSKDFTDEDVKLFLVVQKNLPYQVAVKDRSEMIQLLE